MKGGGYARGPEIMSTAMNLGVCRSKVRKVFKRIGGFGMEQRRKEYIHGLLGGMPLCGFSTDLPVNWPEGHTWVPTTDEKAIGCPSCRQVLETEPAHKHR